MLSDRSLTNRSNRPGSAFVRLMAASSLTASGPSPKAFSNPRYAHIGSKWINGK